MPRSGALFIANGVTSTFTAAMLSDLAVIGVNTLGTALTAYTLALSDAGLVIETTSSSAITVTIPLNATTTFPLNTIIELHQYGAGQITLVGATSAVLLRTPSSLTTRAQYSSLSLRMRVIDEWSIGGDMT